PIRSQDDNEDFMQELEKLTISDSKICLPTTNNLSNKVIEATEATKVTEATKMIEEDIVDKAETSDKEENYENQLENGEIVNDELPEFEFDKRTTHPADDSLAK
ncbi:17760_t:CDS:2, partial [Racocetra persica]